jgi:hypothetical protein
VRGEPGGGFRFRPIDCFRLSVGCSEPMPPLPGLSPWPCIRFFFLKPRRRKAEYHPHGYIWRVRHRPEGDHRPRAGRRRHARRLIYFEGRPGLHTPLCPPSAPTNAPGAISQEHRGRSVYVSVPPEAISVGINIPGILGARPRPVHSHFRHAHGHEPKFGSCIWRY